MFKKILAAFFIVFIIYLFMSLPIIRSGSSGTGLYGCMKQRMAVARCSSAEIADGRAGTCAKEVAAAHACAAKEMN